MNQDYHFTLQVLDLFSRYDIEHDLEWAVDLQNGEVRFSVRCNDTFWWGTADAEEITPENFSGIEQAIADVKAAGGEELPRWDACSEALILWISRVRGLRPQGACYPKNEKLWPLFDACGPERETGLGNPYRPEERKP